MNHDAQTAAIIKHNRETLTLTEWYPNYNL